MKKLIIIFLLSLFVAPCYSQLSEGRYISKLTQNGTLYFINPQKLKKLSGIKKFEFDMTLLSWTDSVTVNFTFQSNLMNVPKEIKITSGDKSYSTRNYKPLYIDLKKDHYEIRISAMFPIHELEEIIKSPYPPCFVLNQEGISETASYSLKGWKKEQKKLLGIYNLYEYSK